MEFDLGLPIVNRHTDISISISIYIPFYTSPHGAPACSDVLDHRISNYYPPLKADDAVDLKPSTLAKSANVNVIIALVIVFSLKYRY